MNSRQFVTDCEGPISKNDNAFELCARFLPDGDRFFTLISRYDDYLADVVRKPGYKAGDTLRLILPFLKARGLSNRQMADFSARNILLVPGAGDTLRYVSSLMPSFIISTSYRPYIEALCRVVDFPLEHTYATEVDLDGCEVPQAELERLEQLRAQIASLPPLELPPAGGGPEDLPLESRRTVEVLDRIFWEEVPAMEAGRLVAETNPIGGPEKARALLDSLKRTGLSPGEAMYVGDSITDLEALELVRKAGGLAVSFNGNRYAIRGAELACLSGHTGIISVLAWAFARGGREGVLKIADWSPEGLRWAGVPLDLLERLSRFPGGWPRAERITEDNREALSWESEHFRRTVRGEVVGRLG